MKRLLIDSCVLLAFFVGADSLSWAQTETPELSAPLTLEEVLDQVERNHPKLKGADLERRVSSAKRLEKQGAFDPAIVFDKDTQRYNSYTERGKAKFEALNDLSVGVLTRYGAKVSVKSNFNYGSVKSPASATGKTGTYFLSMDMPLLRGAGINEKSVAERRAILAEPLAQAEFYQYRLATLLRAASSYWDWVAAKLRKDAYGSLYQLAENRSGQTLERARQGDLPLIDAVEAEQEVQRRRESFMKAERELQKASFYLANYLWNSQSTEVMIPSVTRVPLNLPEPELITPEQEKEAKLVALKNRPELAQLNLMKNMNTLDMELAKNQLLPILDLYTAPGVDTGEQSIGPVFKAGVTLVVPLRNRTAKGQIEQAKLKLQKLDLEQKAMIQQILLEVADTISELNTNVQRHQSAYQAYQLAEKLEVAERVRLGLGDSTLFLVNQRERATAEAFIRVIDLKSEYQQAAIRLKAVTGEL